MASLSASRTSGGTGSSGADIGQTTLTFSTSSPKWLMTLMAMRPLAGRRERPRHRRVERLPGVVVHLGLEGTGELVVGLVAAEEVGVADEEGLAVVVGVDEPAGDVVGAATSGSRRCWGRRCPRPGSRPGAGHRRSVRTSMSGWPKTVNRLPAPVFLSASPISRSGFMRAWRMVSEPRRERLGPLLLGHARRTRSRR